MISWRSIRWTGQLSRERYFIFAGDSTFVEKRNMNNNRGFFVYALVLMIGAVLGIVGTTSYLTLKSLKAAEPALFWTFVGSVGTCIGSTFTAISVIVAAYSFASQARRSRESQSVDMLLKLSHEFDGPRLQKARALACHTLQKKPTEGCGSTDAVIDFFEQVGLFARRGLVSTEFVWHEFYYAVFHYYHITKPYRDETRKRDITIWDDFETLYKALSTLQEKRVRNSPKQPTTAERAEFITTEMRLLEQPIS